MNYSYIVIFTVHFFDFQELLSVLLRYCVHIRKIVQKVTSLRILFRYVSPRSAKCLNCYPIKKVCSNIRFQCEQNPFPIFNLWRYEQLYGIMWIWSNIFIQCNYLRSSHRRCSVRKGVLKNFAKFTGKYLCQSPFFNTVASWGLQLY